MGKMALYDLDKLEAAFEEAQKSRMKPLGAMLMAIKPKLLAYLGQGFTIRDVIAVLQNAGVDGTERQLRYALKQIGISSGECRAARRELQKSCVQE